MKRSTKQLTLIEMGLWITMFALGMITIWFSSFYIATVEIAAAGLALGIILMVWGALATGKAGQTIEKEGAKENGNK